MLARSRWSALILAAFAVLPPVTVLYTARITRYAVDKRKLNSGCIVAVLLLVALVLTLLASRYVFTRFTDPGYYGLYGGLRWIVFGALVAGLWLLASLVLPFPDRDGPLVPYVISRLLEFGALCLALAASLGIAFYGVTLNRQD